MSSRRLRQALRHVVPSPVPGADAGDDPSHRNAQALRDIGAPFAVDDTGAVLLDELEALRQREQAAAARRNYRLAAQLQDVLAVLEPRSGGRLTLTDCAPSSVEAQHEFFLENGFCVIHGVIPDDKLDRARAAWLKAEAPARKRWEEGRAAAAPKNSQERLAASGESQYRTFFDIGKLYDTEDTFLDIIDSPRTLPLLCLLCGGGGESLEYNPTYGQVRFGGQGGRVVPPDINPEGYCGWHRDFPAPDAWPRPKSRLIKAFTYLWDCPLNGGEGALVPGSHRLLCTPDEALACEFRSGHNIGFAAFGQQGVPDVPQAVMPNCVRFSLPAGSCVLFDTPTWHTSMPNLCTRAGQGGGVDGRSRCTVQTNFQSSSYNWGSVEGREQTWRNLDRGDMPSRETLRRLEAEGKLGLTRRRILGLPDEGSVP